MFRRCIHCLQDKSAAADFKKDQWLCTACVDAGFQDMVATQTTIQVNPIIFASNLCTAGKSSITVGDADVYVERTTTDPENDEEEEGELNELEQEEVDDDEEGDVNEEEGPAIEDESNQEADCEPEEEVEHCQVEDAAPAKEKGCVIRERLRPTFRQDQFEKFEDIRAHCQASGKRWVDPNPPDTEYGGDSAHGIEESTNVPFWMPVPKIAGATQFQFLISDPDCTQLKRMMSPDDMKQGDIGSCWFLSAVALLAKNMSMMMAFVCTRQDEEYGIYEFTFRPLGRIIRVCVDDQIPVLNDVRGSYKMPMAHSRTPGELWPTLIEKAYAKLYGSYRAIEYGTNNEAISDLLGLDGAVIEFADYTSKTMKNELLDMYASAFHLGCAWNEEKDGLVDGHAYSIQKLKFAEVPGRAEKQLFLRLHNPWGTGEWTGQFSDDWPGWEDQLYERLKYDLKIGEGADDGAFWMIWDDFAANCACLMVNSTWILEDIPSEEDADGDNGAPETKRHEDSLEYEDPLDTDTSGRRKNIRSRLKQSQFRKFKDIAEECQREDKRWVDPNSPDTKYTVDGEEMAPFWVPLPRIAGATRFEFTISDQPLIRKKMSPDDMEQGELGTCWFLSAVALLACNMEMMMAFVCTRQDEDYGIYEFTFRPNGKEIRVCVDDRIPVLEDESGNRRTPMARSKTPGELWPMLIEKAYAKLFGGYENIQGGFQFEAISDLLGLEGDVGTFEPKALKNKLLEMTTMSFHLGCTFKSPDDGLVTGHAYSIQKLRFARLPTGEEKLFLRIHNPWGAGEWTGPYSDEWSGWDDKAFDRLKFVLRVKEKDDGAFWMSFDDFCDRYEQLHWNTTHRVGSE